MSPDGTRALSGDSFIFDGNDPAHPAKTIEGPKVYKRNGWYYILAPAGGVRKGWQCALRSRSVHGPYEIRTVMDQGESLINGPHQGALVDTAEGDEWFFHFQDRGLYGRICHLQPVSWREDWPVIGYDPMDRGCGQPVFTMEKPAGDKAPDVSPCYLESSDDFPEGRIGLQWQWMGNARAAAGAMGLPLYSPLAEGGIRLHAVNLSGEASPILWHSANVLTQKLVLPEFVCDIRMRLTGLVEGDRAGIAMTGGQYALLYVRKEAAGACLVYAESEGGDQDKKEKVLTEIPLPGSVGGRDPLGEMTFRLIFARRSCYRVTPEGEAVPLKEDIPDLFFAGDEAEKPALSLFWSPDGEEFSGAGCEYVPSDHTWVGAKIGVFALSEDEEGGYADLVSVRTEKIG
jgi:beta-xylosidase